MYAPYCKRKLLFIVQQFAVMIFLCGMYIVKNIITADEIVQFVVCSLAFWDAAYIAYRNIKANHVLARFSSLLSLLGWQFLLSLFHIQGCTVLLPVCLCQSFCFLQSFVFQSSAYKGQKQIQIVCNSACILSVISFLISDRAFAITYQIQYLLSLAAMVLICVVHHRRVAYFLRSQRKAFFLSLIFVVIPFAAYIAVFLHKSMYVANMGSCFPVMLTFFSVHNIVFQYHPAQERFFILKKKYAAILLLSGLSLLVFVVGLLEVQLMALFVLMHGCFLLALLLDLFLYLQVSQQSDGCYVPSYIYALERLKREELLKKEFANYLHDDILQDLLSIKNLLRKSDQPDMKELLYDTLNQLNASIRSQMEEYHPMMISSLPFIDALQSLLDTLTQHSTVSAILDCDKSVFLVEPYNTLIYRIIHELTVNALKHSNATKIWVLLTLEHDVITLKVSDNGIGFDMSACKQAKHRGLASIQEQVSFLEGSMSIETGTGVGTKILITMPMRGESSYESLVN